MAASEQVYIRRDVERQLAFSQSVRAGDFLFVSGCLSWGMDCVPLHAGNWQKQIEEVYSDIGATLAQAGLDFSHVVKETIYCLDIDELIGHAAARSAFYASCAAPASTWVQVSRLAHPDLLLEVEVTAFG